MARRDERKQEDKISTEFAARLREKPAEAAVSVLVIVGGPVSSRPGGRRSRAARRAAIKELRQRTEAALRDIAAVIEAHGGRVTFSTSGVLGAVGLQTSVAGVWALAESASVKAIKDDQPIE